MWPALPAKKEENASPTGLPLALPELVDCLILLAARLEAQTEAIQALAESNMMLVAVISQDQEQVMDEPISQFMDGSSVR